MSREPGDMSATPVLPLARGGFRFEPAELGNRLNDGYVDPAGRLWFGTMHDGETEASGALYCLEAGPSVRRWDRGYTVTNGPAMSPDGRTLYHVDTLGRVIWAFDAQDNLAHLEYPADTGIAEFQHDITRLAQKGWPGT